MKPTVNAESTSVYNATGHLARLEEATIRLLCCNWPDWTSSLCSCIETRKPASCFKHYMGRLLVGQRCRFHDEDAASASRHPALVLQYLLQQQSSYSGRRSGRHRFGNEWKLSITCNLPFYNRWRWSVYRAESCSATAWAVIPALERQGVNERLGDKVVTTTAAITARRHYFGSGC